MELDLKLLQAFAEVSNDLSFSRAARRLNTTQPRLSVRVQTLEQRLGFALFHRGSRRLELTPEGEQLIEPAVRVLREAERAREIATAIQQDLRTRVRLGASPLFTAERWLILERFASENPQARPRVVTGPTPDLLAQLRMETLDLGFLVGEPPDDLESVVLWTSGYGLVVPTDSPLAEGDSIPFARLAGLELDTFPREAIGPLYSQLGRLSAECPVKLVDALEGNSEAILQHVSLTRRAVVAPRWWRDENRPPDGVVFRPIVEIDHAVSFYMARSSKPRPGAAANLWNLIARGP